MAYTITLTDGTVLTTIADATVDNTSSLTLLGRNYPGYGQVIADDLVHLLENFSDTTSPVNPITGQLWYNSTTQLLNFWNGTIWQSVGFTSSLPLVFTNQAAPANERTWRILVSNTSPYIGMLVFEAMNDDGTVRNTVMALDGVNNLIKGQAIYS